ncbi:unnamed protein product, partial [Polarella glacialis]
MAVSQGSPPSQAFVSPFVVLRRPRPRAVVPSAAATSVATASQGSQPPRGPSAYASFPPSTTCKALALGALCGVLQRTRRKRYSTTVSLTGLRAQGSLAEIGTLLSISEVEQRWQKADALGMDAQKMAEICALLCCLQRQLGYWAALHEGSVGTGGVVSRAPSLPLILSWEGPGLEEEEGRAQVYGMSCGATSGETLLQQLLGCGKLAAVDKRFLLPGVAEGKELKAKVSLLRGFVDISASPGDWVPGTHGLWYSDGARAQLVYSPEVAETLADGASADDMAQKLLQSIRKRLAEGDNSDENSEKVLEAIPQGHLLFRFEALKG